MLKATCLRSLPLGLILLVSAACAPLGSEPVSTPPLTLHIAHINDTHSAFDPIDGQFQAQEQRVYNQWGGHPRLLTRIEQHRQAASDHQLPFLVLHGGDAWQGTAYFKVNEGRMNADILSRMGIDAMALGNHEFDLSNAHLNTFIEHINFPVLAANIDTSNDPDLADQANLKAYTLFRFDGADKQVITRADISQAQRQGAQIVAVFGIALDDMPSISPNVGEVVFHDMVTSAQAMVDELHDLGVAHILAVTHVGNAVDVSIAAQVNGIDAIIGGHSHSLLGDFRQLGLGQSARPYAERVANPNGTSFTCVVQAGEYAQAVGLLELSFDTDGQLTACGGGNTVLSNAAWFSDAERQQSMPSTKAHDIKQWLQNVEGFAIVDEDPALREVIDTTYREPMLAAYGAPIGSLPEPIMHVRRPGDSGSDQHGSQLAPLIAAAQFNYANSPAVQRITGLKPDFALVGAGGIRSGLEEGEIREGTITLEVLPFASPLSIVPLRGSVVRDVIEQTIIATLPDGAHAGRFPYGGQLRYTFRETDAGIDGEVTSIQLNTGTIDAPRWRDLEDNVLYNVVMNSYIATGNDGWLAVAEAQRERSDRVDLIYVNGELQTRAVARIHALEGGRLQVEYQGQGIDCSASDVACNTDATAVVSYLKQRSQAANGVLIPLSYPTVTLERVNH